ncbi:UNKNOWN [Stylonychia lemnae]|uniref:Testis-expressed sequence 9 protein n=1 Tax=Stylonychia lemnae TaxID=5949 RepID=A0A078B4M4_STYLE|nr:UNKNOWN [Stylonychia lemnae]|eukprot:CDW88177.1 UNKNOWN [Stylonychia lemnae]
MNKLDYLAQKEEELRKLNEQLEQRKNNILDDEKEYQIDTKTNKLTINNGRNPFAQDDDDHLDQNEDDDDFNKQFHNDDPKFRQSATSLLKEAKQLRESYQRDKTNDRPAVSDHYDDEFNSALSEVERYREVLEKSKEQEKIINFQKAKIAALQAELEDALKSQNKVESKHEDLESQNKKLAEEAKKFNEKMNQSNIQMQKLKQQNQDLQTKLNSLEKSLQEQNKELDAIERDKKKTGQEVGTKDAKLNRAIEELEKYKLQLKEAKASEVSKSDTLRKDMDRLLEENRKLERQRNELMQAFKKQMKLIDILKRQKMHIEAAKLLAFTEDEFVKTLELGDKM